MPKGFDVTTVPITYGFYLRVRAFTNEARWRLAKMFPDVEWTTETMWMKEGRNHWYQDEGCIEIAFKQINCNIWYTENDAI